MERIQQSNRVSKYLINKILSNIDDNVTIYLPFNGWDKTLTNLHSKLIMLDSKYQIKNLCLDRGVLRFEIQTDVQLPAVAHAIARYIMIAQYECMETCLICGKRGFIQVRQEELMPLCTTCK